MDTRNRPPQDSIKYFDLLNEIQSRLIPELKGIMIEHHINILYHEYKS